MLQIDLVRLAGSEAARLGWQREASVVVPVVVPVVAPGLPEAAHHPAVCSSAHSARMQSRSEAR